MTEVELGVTAGPLFEQESAKLWRSLFLHTGDREAASDAVAEAFAQLIRRGSEVRDPRAWVWRSAFRIADRDEVARRKNPVLRETSYDLPEPVVDLVRALRQLPASQRQAVVLHTCSIYRLQTWRRCLEPVAAPSRCTCTAEGDGYERSWETTMTRLQDRFDIAKQLTAPDLSDALGRQLREPSSSPQDDGRHIGRRVLAGAVAFVIFVAAGAFAWRAFGPTAQKTTAGPPNDVLHVTCDATSVQVASPLVAAQSDGVHVLADASGLGEHGAVMLQSVSEPQLTYASGSEGVSGEFARPVPVGEAIVWCGTAETATPADAATFTVVDPSGYFIDYRPACSKPEAFGHNPIPSFLQPYPSSPEDVVRKVVNGLQPTDEVGLAGYPDNSGGVPHVRVVRDGSVIAFFMTNQGSSFITAGWICPSSGLSYPTQHSAS